MKILLIEPDRLLSISLERSLTKAGHQVMLAHSAQAAVSTLDRSSADFIILEPQLGLHNGIEFLYELRSYADWQNIPVVIHSANRAVLDEQYNDAWRQVGVVSVLYKPHATTQQLLRAVAPKHSIQAA